MKRTTEVFLSLLCAVCVLCPTGSHAYLEPSPDVREAVIDASEVARISIITEEKSQFDCGYIYTGRIIEEIKGKAGPQFTFFSEDRIMSQPIGKSILLFSYHIDHTQYSLLLRNILSEILSNEQIRKIGCLTSNDYYVPREFRAVIPFEKKDNLGGEYVLTFPHWDGPPSRPYVRLCESLRSTNKYSAEDTVDWTVLRRQMMRFMRDPSDQC